MSAATYSAHVAQKADRLLAEGKVREVSQPHVFLVQGSAPQPYCVFILPEPFTSHCSCVATVRCAHIAAAELAMKREEQPS